MSKKLSHHDYDSISGKQTRTWLILGHHPDAGTEHAGLLNIEMGNHEQTRVTSRRSQRKCHPVMVLQAKLAKLFVCSPCSAKAAFHTPRSHFFQINNKLPHDYSLPTMSKRVAPV
eukprot:1162106-Pelagomonas_calceolata.AAC.8